MMSPGSPVSGAGRSASGSKGTVRPAVRRWVRAACLTRVTIQGSRFSSGRGEEPLGVLDALEPGGLGDVLCLMGVLHPGKGIAI